MLVSNNNEWDLNASITAPACIKALSDANDLDNDSSDQAVRKLIALVIISFCELVE